LSSFRTRARPAGHHLVGQDGIRRLEAADLPRHADEAVLLPDGDTAPGERDRG